MGRAQGVAPRRLLVSSGTYTYPIGGVYMWMCCILPFWADCTANLAFQKCTAGATQKTGLRFIHMFFLPLLVNAMRIFSHSQVCPQ